ncbi:hypothetical protein PYV61_01955, partial [Roseisolibacter sp. H3M3-2]
MTSAAPAVALRDALSARGFAMAPLPAQVRFGAGAVDALPEMVDALGARRVLLVASAGRDALVARVEALLGARLAGRDRRAVMHVPADVADAV